MPNEYPGAFIQLLGEHGEDAVILDIGAGGRLHPDPRIIMLDIAPTPNNTVQADCLHLPLRDECVDLILNQAVIEHVKDPQLAFNEMFRILRPGGTLYVEIAFMQPVHQAPHHYFNVTPYGLEYLLRDWEVTWTGTVGTADETLSWIERSLGVEGPRKKRRPTNPRKYPKAASGVSALARKPLGLEHEHRTS